MGSRIQSKCGYLCLAPNSPVEKILLQLEYIEFKVNVVILALFGIAVCSAQDALPGIVSIYEAGQIYKGYRIQAGKCGYSEYSIWSRTCDHKELSAVRPSYSECPTPNIGTIRSPASYKILLRLEQRDFMQYNNINSIIMMFGIKHNNR